MKKKNKKHPEYRQWTIDQNLPCCICAIEGLEQTTPTELHHYQKSGMGMKCSDLEMVPLCGSHHKEIQGKYYIALKRLGLEHIWWWMVQTSNDLKRKYIEEQG